MIFSLDFRGHTLNKTFLAFDSKSDCPAAMFDIVLKDGVTISVF